MGSWTTTSFSNLTQRNKIRFLEVLSLITSKVLSSLLRIVFIQSHCSCQFSLRSLIDHLICRRLLFKTVRNIFEGTVSLWHKSDVYYVSGRMYHLKWFKHINIRLNIWGMQYILDKPWHRLRNRTNAKVCVTIALVVINFFHAILNINSLYDHSVINGTILWSIQARNVETEYKKLTLAQRLSKKSSILVQLSWDLYNITYPWANHIDQVSGEEEKHWGFFSNSGTLFQCKIFLLSLYLPRSRLRQAQFN